ncbi:hypothetical protein E2L08_07205 [Palleronia sediminis]|uniref:Polysaccharide chain length determinant N-terminal domain-containing protein n=1 Tax=Palleronia sediminis TaxID=2547833 RepID=A0A4R6AD55_9RHOB|nr:polysaccharide biosynthesis tyrosine autokinase [Palleronia sediminis]TDL81117.1 hypothetical protein E2L08_07205 [Palleronia sediminis]
MNNISSRLGTPPRFFPAEIDRATADRVELGSLVSDLWRRRSMIVLAVILGGLLAYLAVSRIEPVYSARASFMVDPSRVQLLNADDVVTNPLPDNRLLDSQVAVLQSNLLLEEVIAGFPSDRLAVFDPPDAGPSMRDVVRGQIRALLGMDGSADAVADPLLSPEERWMRRMVGAFRAATDVWREGESYIFNVSVSTGNPELSALMANALVRTYIDQQVRERRASVRDANAFLEDRVAMMSAAVQEAEAAVDEYRAREIADNGVSPGIVEQQLRDLSTQHTLAAADLAAAEARYDQITAVIDEGGISAAADLLTSPFVDALRTQVSELIREDAVLATRVSADHSSRLAIRNQRDLVETELSAEVTNIVGTLRNEMDVARIRTASIGQSLSDLEARLADVSQTTLELRQLERQAAAVRDSYGSLLTRLNETRPVAELQSAGARVVERAVIPGAPSGPRKGLFTALGAAAGFAIALILVFLSVASRPGFARAGELERAAGLPVPAALPGKGRRQPRALLASLRKAPHQPLANGLRRLRGSLFAADGALGASPGGRSLMVTSSVGDEDAISVALGLAHLEARAGRSVVVVDLELHDPRLARALQVRHDPGLAEVLRGAARPEEATAPVPSDGFHLLALSTSDPDLVDAVDPARMADVMAALGDRFDLVVIVAPPVLRAVETLTLAPPVDRTLLVVRQNRTPRGAVMDALRLLRGAGAGPIHLALTMADARAEDRVHGRDAARRHAAA